MIRIPVVVTVNPNRTVDPIQTVAAAVAAVTAVAVTAVAAVAAVAAYPNVTRKGLLTEIDR